ncbi:glycoside hydrolase family 130 protein [Actinocrinis sp.]|uniref:glycoside hydrolase family 130 protein n=1 Tax=Actinocrinis sp. TaxID=1920516 RepID=UPI002D5E226E|nr:glycoside hydrolase family 130 protein [Actinocrinis sp.]HZP49611.1 glycoside hydrolase family 130 protein [Actinocrinis sp.]
MTLPDTRADRLVVRSSLRIGPDPRRVIIKLFVPGEDAPPYGSRAAAVINRVMSMDEATVKSVLTDTMHRFAARHRDLADTFADHFDSISHRLDSAARPSRERRQLIGAYFSHEYAIEGAALCNPSIVAHPDQDGLLPGQLRFILSVRAVGEGHISSVGFRTGVIGPGDRLELDEPGPYPATGRHHRVLCDRALFDGILAEEGHDDELAAFLRRNLSPRFTGDELDRALAALHPQLFTRLSAHHTVERIHEIAANNYVVEFPADSALDERVLWPVGRSESHGMEDARFVRFTEPDAAPVYYATYTAYDGRHIAPQLLETSDFRTFRASQLTGAAAANKGMALFPRKVGGSYLALSRHDRESNALTASSDPHIWPAPRILQTPGQPWGLVQLGNCGPPIETEAGWLVLTHGVGPMRSYALGAMLLDLHDPYRVVAALPEPLIIPQEDERDGYVPNVVYSCGALVHQDTLILPYGTSDTRIAFARIRLLALIERLQAARRTYGATTQTAALEDERGTARKA